MIERQARDMEVRDSNPGTGSNVSLEFKTYELKYGEDYNVVNDPLHI